MATKGLQVDQVADAFVSVPGTRIVVTEAQSVSTIPIAASYTQFLPPTGSKAVVIPVAGTYAVEFTPTGFASSSLAGVTGLWKLVFDEGESFEQTIGDDLTWQIRCDGYGAMHRTLLASIELTAGSHTIKGYVKETSGTDLQVYAAGSLPDADNIIVLTLVTGSGAGGTIVTSKETTANQAVNDTNWNVVTELTTTFTAIEGERALVNLTLAMEEDANSDLFARLLIDGVEFTRTMESLTFTRSLAHSGMTPALTAGSRTLTVEVKTSAGSATVWGTDTQAKSRVDVTQFRGGLVPWERDGVAVLDTPRAINIIGGAMSVADDGSGKLDVTLPTAVTAPSYAEVQSQNDVTGNTSAAELKVFDKNFTVPTAGTYKIRVDITAWSIWAATREGFWEVRVDEGGSNPQVLGGQAAEWIVSLDTASIYQITPHFETVVVLPAGTNNIRVYADQDTTGGSNLTYTANSTPTRVTLESLTGSGAGGVLVDHAAVSPGSLAMNSHPTVPTWQIPIAAQWSFTDVPGLTATFDATPDEFVQVSLDGQIYQAGTGSVALEVVLNGTPYKTEVVDPQNVQWADTRSAGFGIGVARCLMVQCAAGSNTIKIRAAGDVDSEIVEGFTMDVVRYRGGLVPIRQDGTTKLDKPAAINFTGGNTTVTNIGGVATVLIEGVTGTTENEPYFADSAGSVVAPTTGAGSFTVGARFSVDKSGAKVAGAFFETAKAGAHTIRVKLWEESNATALASVDVAVSGPGSYEGRFAVPYAIPDADIAKKNFYISMWETSGVNWTEHNPSVYFDQTYVFRGGYTYWTRAKYFAAGDANPESGSSGVADYPIDPIVVLPAQSATIQPENVPQLSYSSASAVQAVAAPGASSELRVTLNDGVRYKATSPLSADLTVSGIGGIDTGSEAVSTWYQVFAVPSATAGEFDVVASVANPEVGPTGYSTWKYLGRFYNNAASDIREFAYAGAWHYTDQVSTDVEVLNTSSPTTGAWTALTLTAAVPSGGYDVLEVQGHELGAGSNFNAFFVEPSSPSWTPADTASNAGRALTFGQSATCVKQVRNIATEGGLDYYFLVRSGAAVDQLVVRVSGFRDKYLAEAPVQTQAKFVADTKSPQGVWLTATTVDFSARAGQPTTVRLTLQDGKQRTFSGTLNWSNANNVADLGYDEAASQTGTDKWMYFYAVPSSGDDSILTVRASDNPPSVGPTGYSNYKCVWKAYESSTALLEVTQRANRFYWKTQSDVRNIEGWGTTPQTQVTVTGTTYLPVGALEFIASLNIRCDSTGAQIQQAMHQVGVAAAFAYHRTTNQAIQNEQNMPVLMPLNSSRQFDYSSTIQVGPGAILSQSLYTVGWVDEDIDP